MYYRQFVEGTEKQAQNQYWRYSASRSNLEPEKVRNITVSFNLLVDFIERMWNMHIFQFYKYSVDTFIVKSFIRPTNAHTNYSKITEILRLLKLQ